MVWEPGILDAPVSTVKGIDAGLTDICGAPPEPLMVIEKLAEAVSAQASIAVKVKLNTPLETGVPVMERDKSWLV
jgi:hypothetical protein